LNSNSLNILPFLQKSYSVYISFILYYILLLACIHIRELLSAVSRPVCIKLEFRMNVSSVCGSKRRGRFFLEKEQVTKRGKTYYRVKFSPPAVTFSLVPKRLKFKKVVSAVPSRVCCTLKMYLQVRQLQLQSRKRNRRQINRKKSNPRTNVPREAMFVP